jgi:hypothetical protein
MEKVDAEELLGREFFDKLVQFFREHKELFAKLK